jgi:CRISPR-associated endonuclease/helicase Cas3
MSFKTTFHTATGYEPFGFQGRYAARDVPPVWVDIPTGLGKTETTLLPFIDAVAEHRNRFRRLVYVLPMRSLVEQTRRRIEMWLDRLHAAGIVTLPKVALLLGGDVDDDWLGEPEQPYILVGTQDMILSRALNRGYAQSPFRWPMSFGLLHNDTHWVLDEVQLQGVGTRTAAQLQGLRTKLGTLAPTATTFVSATVEREWIDTVDHPVDPSMRFGLDDEDMRHPVVRKRIGAEKTVEHLPIDGSDTDEVARAAFERHVPGTLTLVVLNKVRRAQLVAATLRRLASDDVVHLLHGRFRPLDRKRLEEQLFGTEPDPNGPGRIVVSTQVVEAGVDVDAATLISDLAPWASIVQRLGRCNRRGDREQGRFSWIDLDEQARGIATPYRPEELVTAREALVGLEGKSAAAAHLPRIPIELEAGATLRRVDLLDLFDTTPDLSGSDVDVSRFIREADDFNVSVFWRESPPEGDRNRVRREELCPAPVVEVRNIVERLQRQQRRDWTCVRSTLAGNVKDVWRPATPNDLRPGILVWLRCDVGGYSENEGFQPEARARVGPVDVTADGARLGEDDETEEFGSDRGSWSGAAVTLAMHSEDAREDAASLVESLGDVVGSRAEAVVRAATWHDAGKIHDVFQETMVKGGAPADGGPWAKAPHGARHGRRYFRHELVSALAWLRDHDEEPQADLIAYLVAAHHGKLRVAAWPFPGEPVDGERTLLGVRDGDAVRAANLAAEEQTTAFTVDLSGFSVGSSNGRPTWTDRVLALRDDPLTGPFRLAYLETLVRVADWRASAKRRAAAKAAV